MSDNEQDLHRALLGYCLALSAQCTPVPTGFSVGALLFLPSSSPSFSALEEHFPAFHVGLGGEEDVGMQEVSGRTFEGVRGGLVLGTGYSREREGNTHAEANALIKFGEAMDSLKTSTKPEDVLRDAWIYTTLEPCSVRTSGGPSCTAAILRAGIPRVYMGVAEPPDYVRCEGVRLLREGGVRVETVPGMEEASLKAARRGLEGRA